MPCFTLAPSDLSFLLQDCRACFWLKVRRGVRRPSIPLPTVFTRIHSILQENWLGLRTELMVPELPPGRFAASENWVRSAPIVLPGLDASCVIRGRLDMLTEFDDGSFGVIDFKTAITREVNVPVYGRQLHAYACALHKPAPGLPALWPVTRLGLYCVEPCGLQMLDDRCAYTATHAWIEIPVDLDSFLHLLSEVVSVLASSSPPPGNIDCVYCRYRGLG